MRTKITGQVNLKQLKPILAPERITDSSNLIHDTYGYYTLTTNTYDKNGNLLKQVPNVGAATEYTYNNRNMQTSVTTYTSGENSQSMSESYTYDFLGNVTSQTDRNGNVTKYLYDQRGNLAYTIYPNNKTAFTVYDNTGRLITEVEPGDYTGDVTLQNADITEYETDLAAVDTMNRTEYTYDQKNNVLTAVRYTYNEETQTFDSAVKVTNTYDNAGRLLETTDGLGNTYKYEYDVQGNCIKYTDPTKADTESYTTSYEYDMLGRNTKESNSYGDSYTYTYDKKGNLTGVSVTYNGETDTISTYTYDPAGKLLTQTDGNQSHDNLDV